ncbi:MAG: type II toxin-antitoxin system Phd/YefM family antitoxin [Chloroflexota bacterium]
MADTYVSIGQVKRDISELVNRVAYGKERVVLTSRGKPKAALVSMEDLKRIQDVQRQERLAQLEAWFRKRDELNARILEQTGGKPIDTDAIMQEVKADLEARDDRVLELFGR